MFIDIRAHVIDKQTQLTLLTVTFNHDFLLFLGCALQRNDSQPTALSVLNVSSNLSTDCRIAKAVNEVVLSLEKVADLQQNRLCLSEHFRVLVICHMHRDGDWQIERIVGGLVCNDSLVFIHRERHDVRTGRTQILKLSNGGDESHLLKEIQDVSIVFLVTKVFAQQIVDSTFNHERIVDGAQTNFIQFVPALVTSTSLAVVHDIISNDKHRLELNI